MYLPDLKTVDVKGKRVFLRMDLDAPLKEVKSQKSKVKIEVGDETRLVVGMPTLEYLLSQGASVIVGGHVRRPEGYDPKLSVRPIVEWIVKNIKYQISNIKNENGEWKMENGKSGDFLGRRLAENLFILENLRFYKEEKTNDEDFVRKLANLADIYVNDAFASAHRNHASIVGIPKFLPHFAGFHLQEEIRVLSEILENPKRPLIVIIGGEKIETKLPLVSKMCQLADNILVGGKIAQEMEATKSKVTHSTSLRLRDRSDSRSSGQKSKIRCAFLIADLDEEGTDITKESVDEFIEMVHIAKTIIWNGPVGKITNHKSQITKEDSEYGTYRLAKAIVESGAYTVAGGGDTLEFLKQINLLDKFSFFSTGGGAMLAFLSGEKLPGIEALIK